MMIRYCMSMNYDIEVWVCCYRMIVREGNYDSWVNACFVLMGGDFIHYVVVALTCYDMHSLGHCCWWKRHVTIRVGWVGDLSWIRAMWIRGSSMVNPVPEWTNWRWYGTTCIWFWLNLRVPLHNLNDEYVITLCMMMDWVWEGSYVIVVECVDILILPCILCY